jgi:dihydroflavonol-4-reductase
MILVTGGTGLVGSHLLLELALAYQEVRAVFREESSKEKVRRVFHYYSPIAVELFERIQWHKADVLDPFAVREAMAGCTHVYHCAALISFDPADRRKLFQVNVGGTSNMVDAAIALGVRKFCFASSVASFGSVDPPFQIDETTLRKSSMDYSGYALSKFKSEMEVWRGVVEGLDSVIVNPSVVVGPMDWHEGIGKIFSLVARNLPFYPTGSTGFVDVRDVVRIMIRLMESQELNERYCLNSENLSHQEILRGISSLLGKPQPKIPLNRAILSLTWRLEWIRSRITGKKPLLTRESSRSSTNRSLFSNGKIRKTLVDYSFIPISQSLKNMADIYLLDHPNRKG